MTELRERKTQDREYDIILFGATSFAGALTAEYLLKNYKQSQIRWTIAGRSQSRLENLKKTLKKYSADADELKPLIADSSSKEELDALTRKSHVLISTVGPYIKYGTPVVQSCLDNGTHYVDITGESFWVRQNIDSFHTRAEENGTLLVSMCGYDSIPSDLGTLMVVDHIHKMGGTTTEVKNFVTELKGGFSGGTIATAIEFAELGSKASLSNPFHLCPNPKAAAAAAPAPKDTLLPFYDADIKSWTSFFFMSPVNRQVVRRSAALLQQKNGYSPKFQYSEVMTHNIIVSFIFTFAVVVFGILIGLKPTRALLKRVLPGPGTGPSRNLIENGHWKHKLIATGKLADGKEITVRGTVSGRQDPGYGDTARMLSECAIYLVQNRDKCAKGGVLTTASAFGPTFIDKLRSAGINFTVENSHRHAQSLP